MQGLINQAQGISAILYTVIAIQKILQRLNTPIKLGIQSLLFVASELARRSCLIRSHSACCCSFSASSSSCVYKSCFKLFTL